MSADETHTALEILTLGLEGEIFAIDVAHVREILDLVPVTEVPNSRPFVPGLINVRGSVVPLADLRLKFGMEPRPPTIDARIVVIEIEIDGLPTTVGIRADKVYEVTELAPQALAEAPRVGMRWRPDYIRGIGKRGGDFVVVLDIARIFATGDARDEPAAGPASPQHKAA